MITLSGYLGHRNVFLYSSLHGGSDSKESACNVGDLGSILGLGRSPGEGKGFPLQYSGLEKSMDYSPWGRKELDTTERLSLSLNRVQLLRQLVGQCYSLLQEKNK